MGGACVYRGASVEIREERLLPFVLGGDETDALAATLFAVARDATKFGVEELFGGKSLESSGLTHTEYWPASGLMGLWAQ